MADSSSNYGAFMDSFVLRSPSPSSSSQLLPLHGLTFAIKDIFDIAGRVTGFGNPDWKRTHAPAAATSPVVLAALAAGATSLGTTVMDEMAYSINGENAHYGTPTNPCAPGRVPGGSSSGSAVAVAAKLVDFSLGTDTTGSVRVPAAYCGIFGIRTSHGLVSAENVIPMAQTFDTVGWFARDISTLSRVTKVLLPLPDDTVNQPTKVTIPMDCFQILGSVDDSTYQIVNVSVAKRFGSHAIIDNMNLGDFVCDNVPSIGKFIVAFAESELPSVPALSAISHVMFGLLRPQFKANHAEWVNSAKPNLGPVLHERIHDTIASEDNEPLEDFQAIMAEFKSALAALLKDHGILAIPTVPGPPPLAGMEASPDLENFQARALTLQSIASLSGSCQVSIPVGTRNGVPVSVSLVAQHGADHFLLSVAEQLYQTLLDEATKSWAS
ncbi:amidase 1-like isoform X1 [Oryza brachyantha]|uniref:amidase 1-like isoform X1 n=1 Tax=Oryza brachyantha TaxID=4533 RepID=UPI001AD97E6D|nr:amidase 1-like isoform X1 [Oryza brachyantha]